jgi:hypothetical protein
MEYQTLTVHPFYPDGSCIEIPVRSKCPLLPDWPRLERTHSEVNQWLTSPSFDKYGFRVPPGYVVLDVDRHPGQPDGWESLQRLQADTGINLEETCSAIVDTPQAGAHFIYRVPPGLAFSIDRIRYPSIDIIGPGRQVIGAGSPHDLVPGILYTFRQDNPGAGTMPEILLDRLSTRREVSDAEYEDLGRPGDLFQNSEAGLVLLIEEMLARGFDVWTEGECWSYFRPGHSGTSDRSGYVGRISSNGVFLLVPFSLQDPFRRDKDDASRPGITIFEALARLKFEDDTLACSQWLHVNGFGMADPFDVLRVPEEITVTDNSLDPEDLVTFATRYDSLRPILLAGLLRRTEVMNVIAAPKVGKSWAMINLALCVATGTDWLGFPVQCPGRVLYLDNELDQGLIADRFKIVARALGIHWSSLRGRITIKSALGTGTTLSHLPALLHKYETGTYSLCVLDALYKLWPPGINENDNAAVTKCYENLALLGRSKNMAIALVHHASKGNQSEKSSTDVGSGAGAISRAADTHLVLREHDTPGRAVLTLSVRSFPETDSHVPRGGLTLERTGGIWTALPDTPAVLANPQATKQREDDNETDLRVREVLEVLEDPSSLANLAAQCGYGREKVRRSVSRLIGTGEIEIVEAGTRSKYKLKDGPAEGVV